MAAAPGAAAATGALPGAGQGRAGTPPHRNPLPEGEGAGTALCGVRGLAMATDLHCPACGGISTDPEFCSDCGALMAPAPAKPAAAPAAAAAQVPPIPGAPDDCPICGEARPGPFARYCDNCRYDFLEKRPFGTAPAPVAPPSAAPPSATPLSDVPGRGLVRMPRPPHSPAPARSRLRLPHRPPPPPAPPSPSPRPSVGTCTPAWTPRCAVRRTRCPRTCAPASTRWTCPTT